MPEKIKPVLVSWGRCEDVPLMLRCHCGWVLSVDSFPGQNDMALQSLVELAEHTCVIPWEK